MRNEEYITQNTENQIFYPNGKKPSKAQNQDSIIQNAENQIFSQNGEKVSKAQNQDSKYSHQDVDNRGGRPSATYKLSVNCMQFLIARERTQIFDVYRKVFDMVYDAMKPVNGVYPIMYRGRVLYNYNEILRSLGYSTSSGSVSKRKRMFPANFVKIGTNNYINIDFVRYLTDQKKMLIKKEELKTSARYMLFKEEDFQ